MNLMYLNSSKSVSLGRKTAFPPQPSRGLGHSPQAHTHRQHSAPQQLKGGEGEYEKGERGCWAPLHSPERPGGQLGERDAPVCGESIGGGLGREDGEKWEKSSSSSSLSMGSFPQGGSMQPHCNHASVPFLINERKKTNH